MDYYLPPNERRKMSKYLRAGNFRKIAGTPSLAGGIQRRRFWLAAAALLILAVGLVSVIR